MKTDVITQTLLFLFTIISQVTSVDQTETFTRFKDVALKQNLTIADRTVTCSGSMTGHTYPSPMYTCMGIRVDGYKIHYATHRLTSSFRDRICPTDEKQESTNIKSLCLALLLANNITQPVAAAYAPKPTCTHGLNNSLYRFLWPSSGAAIWRIATNTTNGHLNTIQCLTDVS